MDISSKLAGLALPVEEAGRMTIVHPFTSQPLRDKDGNEAWIDVYSADSDIARRHNQSIQRRRIASQRGTRGSKITPEELEAEGIELLVALTKAWNLVSLDGTPIDLPFSADAARQVYANRGLAYLREQVDAFAADRGNFSKASSTN